MRIEPAPGRAIWAIDIAVGQYHSCALKQDHRVICWGQRFVSPNASSSPVARMMEDYFMRELEQRRFESLARGGFCGITLNEQNASCWWFGSPYQPPSFLDHSGPFDALEPGCAIRVDGSALCWHKPARIEAEFPKGRYRHISLGGFMACAVTTTGKVKCLTFEGSVDPPLAGRYREVNNLRFHLCALRQDGHVECITYDSFWEPPSEFDIETGEPVYREPEPGQGPRDFDVSTNERFVAFDTQGIYQCGIRPDRSVKCWGRFRGAAWPLARAPKGLLAKIGLGTSHICGLRPRGTVECWGSNAQGQTAVPAELR